MNHQNNYVSYSSVMKLIPKSAGNDATVFIFSVIAFEIQLKEIFDRHPNSPSRERIDVCMGLLEDIMPLLGSLTPIFKVINDEIYRSIYSKSLTSSERNPYIERISFFSALKNVDESR